MLCNDKSMRGRLEKKFGFISFVNYIFIYLPMKTMQNKFTLIFFYKMLKKLSRFTASSVVIALCFVLQLFSCNTKKVLMISR